MPQSLLSYYEHKARSMSLEALAWSLADVVATLDLHREKPTDHPYVAKLLAEFDAYTVALQRARKSRRIGQIAA